MTSVSMTCQLKREVTMKRINLKLKVAATTLSLLCFAPAAFAANSADSTFTIGIGITLDSLDPAQQTTTTVMNVLDYDVQTLVLSMKQASFSLCRSEEHTSELQSLLRISYAV